MRTQDRPAPSRSLSAGPARRDGLRFRCSLVGAALALAVCVRALLAAEPTTVVVVVNSAGPLTAATSEQIRDIFLGRLRTVADVRVRPIQIEGRVREVALRALLGMTEREFQLYWMRKTYELGLMPPPVREGADQVLRYVAQEKGAIGFVDAASLQGSDAVTVVYEVHPRENAP